MTHFEPPWPPEKVTPLVSENSKIINQCHADGQYCKVAKKGNLIPGSVIGQVTKPLILAVNEDDESYPKRVLQRF